MTQACPYCSYRAYDEVKSEPKPLVHELLKPPPTCEGEEHRGRQAKNGFPQNDQVGAPARPPPRGVSRVEGEATAGQQAEPPPSGFHLLL
jgi:hypothetical protein